MHKLVLRLSAVFCGLAFAIWCQAIRAQSCAPGDLRVIVIDSQESPVFNANVRIESAPTGAQERSTQTAGSADFTALSCGSWTATVSKDGFETATQSVELTGVPKIEVSVVLVPKMQTTSVDVNEKASVLLEQSASSSNKLEPIEVKRLPTNPATVNEALPLEPGVVRGLDGELKIDGSGQERSAMVVNQTDITDPATGKFGQTLPVDSVETVNVLNTPFLAQYGRFTQSVIAIETKRGGDKWHADLNDPFPDFRIRSYHMRGIRDASPRLAVEGPLMKDRVYFISAFQYSFQTPSSRTLPYPFNESRQEYINSFSQLDYVASTKQIITTTFHFSPQHTNFVNPDYFNPQPVTPSFAQRNYTGTVADRWGLFDGILESSYSSQRFNVDVGAQGPADMVMTPLGNRGNFFGTQNRSAGRQEWLENWSLAPIKMLGTHLFKLGTSLTHSTNEGRFNYHSIDIINASGLPEQRIAFSAPPPYTRTDLELTSYLQDHWSIARNFALDFGGRLEHQRLATTYRIAPRGGFAWNPFSNSRTVFRAGYGLFYDHLPLDIYSFSRYPQRTVTFFNADGSMQGEPTPYLNVIGSVIGPRSFFINGQQVAGAFSPRGGTLNLQFEHIASSWLRLRAVYTDNQSVGLVVLEPAVVNSTNEIVLNGNGSSRYRQLEFNARLTWKDDQQMMLSYTRSRATGNLNTFDSFLGNFPTPLVRPNLSSNLPGDLPDRFLAWGHIKTHIWGLELYPLIEFHSGFPYASLDAHQNYVGTPFRDDTRFPHFFAADARLSKDFKVNAKYTIRISGTVLNGTNHFNALAVHNNIADPMQGIFFGNYHRRYRGDFDIVF